MKSSYVSLLLVLQRVNILFLNVLESHLQDLNCPDINATQALILYNIGTKKLNMTEIMNKGYYLKSNASYSLDKMIKNGYLIQGPSPYDKRAKVIYASKKGLSLHKKIEEIFLNHIYLLENKNVSLSNIQEANHLLSSLEDTWKALLKL